jgi:heme exporter protein D
MIDAIADFLGQGGYAGFVWGAFGMTFGLMLAEVVLLHRSRRTILARIGRLLRVRGRSRPRAVPGEHTIPPEGLDAKAADDTRA